MTTDSPFDGLEKIGQYRLTSQPLGMSENLFFCEDCEDDEGNDYEILIIRNTEVNSRKLKRIIEQEIKQIVGQDIKGFVKTIAVDYDNVLDAYYVVYEHFGEYTYERQKDVDIDSIIAIAEGLNYFKTNDNSQKFIISPKYIKVNREGVAKLLFAKLYDVFAEGNCLEQDYLSTEAEEYLKDKTQLKPNLQDDIYSLIKTFENFLQENYNPNNIIDSIFEKSITKKRQQRFAKYHELLDLLRQLPSIKKKQYPQITVVTQRDYYNDFQF